MKEIYKVREDEDEDVCNYWIALRKKRYGKLKEEAR
jgi:hypothetical protein